jgi:hypothetical protein
MIALRTPDHPLHHAPENILSFTPWIHLGLQVIAGTFEVEAGPAERIQLYENPPREYVVGGKGEGDFGVFAPELGAGGELRMYLGQTQKTGRSNWPCKAPTPSLNTPAPPIHWASAPATTRISTSSTT